MEFNQAFADFRSSALKRVATAAAEDRLEEVNRLARIASDCDAALTLVRSLEAEHKRISAALAGSLPPKEIKKPTPPPSGAEFPRSPRARAKEVRLCWAEEKKLQLHRTGEVTFKTTSGKRVGVPFARELEQSPDLWFLGLPDEDFEYVVLLCESGDGRLLDFVFPPQFVSSIWRALARDGNRHVKFHIVRSEKRFKIRLKGPVFKDITNYLGQTALLREE